MASWYTRNRATLHGWLDTAATHLTGLADQESALASAHERLDPLGRPVEAAREPADLVAAAHLGPALEVALGKGVDALGESLDAPRHPACQRIGAERDESGE